MKIFYLGTVCNLQAYERIIDMCKQKPTIATVVFESALMEGFKKNNADVEIMSFPMIPTFPHSKYMFWGNRVEKLPCGYSCTWLKTVNVPYLKQWTRCQDAKKHLIKWLKNNTSEECVVLAYGIVSFLAPMVIDVCRQYGAKCCAIVADLPRDMYLNSQDYKLIAKLKKGYLNRAIAVQGMFDGYIYLTEEMKNIINPNKPYMVMEGIANIKKTPNALSEEKSVPRGIMYAGGLHEQYGIINLLEAYEEANIPDTELWLFGDGNAVDKIKNSSRNKPSIRYFGRKTHKEVLEFEKKATLLVNVRSTDDEFVKYSFPSKTIEYMLSGTPLLTTKLPGIPSEYFNYVYTLEDNTVEHIRNKLSEILSEGDDSLADMGRKAQKFIGEQKNDFVQAQRILSFLKDLFK